MPMPRTDNPYRDFLRHEDEVEEWVESRPCCDICGEHIVDEGAYCIEGTWYHKDCLDKYWKWF